jgi:hypothetical protein
MTILTITAGDQLLFVSTWIDCQSVSTLTGLKVQSERGNRSTAVEVLIQCGVHAIAVSPPNPTMEKVLIHSAAVEPG